MIESLIDATALPNLHPALVHFPIAFLPLALALDAAGLLLHRQRWLAPAATTVYAASALGGWLAVWAGEQAADGLVAVPAAVQPRIGEHSDWAHWTMYALGATALLRLVIHLAPRMTDHRGARAIVALLGLATLGVLGKAADLGGALVFQHGVGSMLEHGIGIGGAARESSVETTQIVGETLAPSTPGSAESRLIHEDDGSIVWRPAPGDREALGSILVPAAGSDFSAVRWIENDETEGLTLAVNGEAMLLLPGLFGDVQVEAYVALGDFAGTIGVVHHARSFRDSGFFTLATDGTAVLSDVRGGAHNELDRKAATLPEDAFTLSVSAAGRHLKGMIDGRTITHGHVAAGEDGACGLLLTGHGTLRILRATVIPLNED